jgi:hypothetical protein
MQITKKSLLRIKRLLLGPSDNLAGGGGLGWVVYLPIGPMKIKTNELTQNVDYGGQSLGWFYRIII